MPLEADRRLDAAGPRRRLRRSGYFESWNLESLQGVIDAAEETRSPIIIGFNGDFLSRPDRLAEERLDLVRGPGPGGGRVGLGPLRPDLQRMPGGRLGPARRSTCGFNLVMPADPEAPLRTLYTDRVARADPPRSRHGVAVEAELGELPCGPRRAMDRPAGSLTDPGLAAEFVEATGVDLLAVSVGNVHVKLDGDSGAGPGPARADPHARARSPSSSTAARASAAGRSARRSPWASPR